MINNNMISIEQPNEVKNEENMTKPDESPGVFAQGHIKIFDPETNEVFVNKRNAIHYENFSEALANSLSNKTNGFIYKMAFGSGGTSVSGSGVITYYPPNTSTQNTDLYTVVYEKVVDDTSLLNTQPTNNKLEVRHVPGTVYSDILVTCLLDYGEPASAPVIDYASNVNTETFVFDELGLKTATGKLLTHVIFHPVQKSLNRLIQIDYTVRVQTLTNLSSL